MKMHYTLGDINTDIGGEEDIVMGNLLTNKNWDFVTQGWGREANLMVMVLI